jgi:hypothetical protein
MSFARNGATQQSGAAFQSPAAHLAHSATHRFLKEILLFPLFLQEIISGGSSSAAEMLDCGKQSDRKTAREPALAGGSTALRQECEGPKMHA